MAVALLVSAVMAGGCASTTTVTDVTTADGSLAPVAPPTVPIPVDGTLDELLAVLLADMADLPERVVDNDDDEVLLDRIEATWALTEDIIEVEHPGALFGFQQAVNLSRTGVERRRPADASRGAKLAAELAANLDRG
jgi:hypothetical protein